MVDNELYNRPGDIWWDEQAFLSTLHTALNPARFGYFRRVLEEDLRVDPAGRSALDVGCGGGLLAEEFARLGCRVTGIDPSEPSLQTARAHAARSGLDIEYRQGTGEALPFGDSSFDLVYCCDVLEHVSDLSRVIAETARVLRPGGVYLFDTINRTLLSRLVVIGLLQEWERTRIAPPNLHAWQMFIKPAELRVLLIRHGLELREIAGLGPAIDPIRLIRVYRELRQGRISFGEMGRRLAFKQSRMTWASYMGHAIKP